MIIWTGLGILVPVIAALDLVIFTLIGTNFKLPVLLTWVIFCVIVFLSAIGMWYLAKVLDKNSLKELIDPKTNEKLILKKSHTFFFIPMKAWAVIFVVLDILWFIFALYTSFSK
jgi:hypothetical protein